MITTLGYITKLREGEKKHFILNLLNHALQSNVPFFFFSFQFCEVATLAILHKEI
jgi:hypothetical protein